MALSAFLPPRFDSRRAVALIAGQGVYPLLVAAAIRAAGIPLKLVAFEEETRPELVASFPPGDQRMLKVGQLGHMLDALRDFPAGYALMFDWKLPEKSKGEFEVTFGTHQQYGFVNADLTRNGKWNRLSFAVDAGGVIVTKDGLPASKTSRVVDKGPIRFKGIDGLELRNVYRRELPAKK